MSTGKQQATCLPARHLTSVCFALQLYHTAAMLALKAYRMQYCKSLSTPESDCWFSMTQNCVGYVQAYHSARKLYIVIELSGTQKNALLV